jgi:subtilisin family serine protease
LSQALSILDTDAGVSFSSPVYDYQGRLQVPTGHLLVGRDEEADESALLATCEELGLRNPRHLEAVDAYRLEMPAHGPIEAPRVAALLDGRPGVLFAEPVFLFQPLMDAPDDPLFGDSWHLDNTGQHGFGIDADLDALEAWSLVTGSPDVVVAIIDEGVDMDHEDLAPSIVAGIDVTDRSASPPGGVAGNASSSDPHGTACAGIVGALGGNGKGSVGVAYGCSLMSVRIARGASGTWTTNEWAASGIELAWRGGADILSNSWGGGTPSSVIDAAVVNAVTRGRSGLGCVVLFATGNNNGAVHYPANLPWTLGIGATSPCDERKSPTSCDGESWWGSNWGPGLDLVAPGVLIRTTDIMGSGGYGRGNYLTGMNGTSAATPAVAGVAALVLSANPLLRWNEVREVVRSTADDLVGTPGEDIPGFDPFMGYGRVNAYRAVLAVAPPEPPVLTAVDPSSGPLRGGTRVTVHGERFLGEVEALVGGVSVPCELLSSSEMRLVMPPHAGKASVEVRVRTAGGESWLAEGFEYQTNPRELSYTGYPQAGRTLTLVVSGEPGSGFAIAADDNPGSYFRQGFEFCFEGPSSDGFRMVKRRSAGLPLDAFGLGSVPFVIPEDALPLSEMWVQAGLILPDGSLEITNCLKVTVF